MVCNYDPTPAMCAVNVLYDVGARDEDANHRGLAHLFEHLMFGGSEHIPEFDEAIDAAGGSNNAWTSDDFTNFYDILPAQNIETAFWLESDRMLSLSFSQKALNVQQHVVIEEFKQQCLNKPYGDLTHHLRAMVYPASHPYSVPVIGRRPEDIASFTLDDIRRFFFSHYAPNNAILVVAGSVKPETVFALSEKWFGDIPRREIAPRQVPAAQPLAAPVQKIVSGNVPATDITIAFPMAPYGTEEYFAADLLTDLWANGASSRFYRELLMGTDIFTQIDASITGCEYDGMLMINSRLRGSGEAEEQRAIEAIRRVVDRFIAEGPGEFELHRALNRMESARTFAAMSCEERARETAIATYHGEDPARAMEPYRRLTPETVRQCAADIIARPAATLIYRPNTSTQA